MLIIYSVSTYSLWQKLRQYSILALEREKCSIMTQFCAFLFSAIITIGFSLSQFDKDETSFTRAVMVTISSILS